jgi:transcriptional regulator with XRE-family HTH domain
MATSLKQRIGIRLRSMRGRAELTQERLAALVDRTPETISNIERGHTLPSLATLEDLSQQLKVPIRDFFDDEANEGKTTRRRLELESKLRGFASALPDVDLELACDQVEALARRALKKAGVSLSKQRR